MLEKNVREGGLFFYYIIIKPQKIDERYKFDLHELDGIMAHGMHVRKRVEERYTVGKVFRDFASWVSPPGI